jgi:CubicO group peptidase (beta-lactamase class C family)
MSHLATSTMQVVCAAMLLCGVVTTGSPAQTPSAPKPFTGRARVAVARQLHDSVAPLMRQAVTARAFPGAYVVVGDSRGVLLEMGVGHLDWARSPKPTRETMWDLASLTKVLATTTALAQLVERGMVQLDAPVQRYLPEWTGPDKDAVTVRHLLTHSSGAPAFRNYDQQTHDPDTLAALIFTTPLERPAGERMVYSDIGAFVAGKIVERVSGRSLDAYVAKHIAEPLGLRETMFRPPASFRPRIAPTEFDSLRGGLVRGFVHDERAYYLGGVAAHAGLFSSARDLQRFATMMLHGGTLDGQQILKRETIAQFTASAAPAFSNRALGWQKPERAGMQFSSGAAWAGRYMTDRAYGHTGFTGTSIAIEPDLDLYIILLSNRVNPTRDNPRITEVRRRVADVVVAVMRERRGQPLNAGLP